MKKLYDRILDMRGSLLTIIAKNIRLGEMARIYKQSGDQAYASVLSIDREKVTLQVFENTRGISTNDRVTFLGTELQVVASESLLGRRFNGAGDPIDKGAPPVGEKVGIHSPSFNPVCRALSHELVRTNIPMIDVFNCLVRSQKMPIFSTAGEPFNPLLMRIANQTNADIVIIGGMGLRFDDYQALTDNAEKEGYLERTIMFIHQATDPSVECLLVPDLALACAEKFAVEGKHVLVLFTDMTAFADAIKEIAITMDQIPSNRGYPGSLYSNLASRYEKAIALNGGGSITILSVVTMPGGDITHPIPDNTGYITEGQLLLKDGCIIPSRSLSRLKQQVVGKVTREDHAEVSNAQIRLYSEGQKSRERQSMGFNLYERDRKLLRFVELFEQRMMNLSVNQTLEEALDVGWQSLRECFEPEEIGIKQSLIDKYWPK